MIAQPPPDDRFGCFCKGAFDPPPHAPDGPLHGLSFAVKDLIDTRGAVSGAGNPDWRRTHSAADRNATVVQTLLDAGARLVGRTITDEMAFSLEGDNHFEGAPINPCSPGRLSGGSSSGSAVAVAAGLVDFALGTDTGGSVRVPASFCGIFGMRPTHSAISNDGVVPFAPSLDTVGWFARDAATLRRVGDVLLPTTDSEPIRWILIADDAFSWADVDVSEPLRHAVGQWPVARGATNASPVSMDTVSRCYQVSQAVDVVAALGLWLREVEPRFGPTIAPRFDSVFRHDRDSIDEMAKLRQRLREHLAMIFKSEPGLAIALPSAPCEPLQRGLPNENIQAFYQRALALAGLASLAGLPQISLPLRSKNGLPVGISLLGPTGSDRALLDFANSAVSGVDDTPC